MKVFITLLCSIPFVVVANDCDLTLLESKIIGGQAAPFDTIKYIVSLRYDGSHFCAGTLISVFNVLTSASCIYFIREKEKSPYTGFHVLVGNNTLSGTGTSFMIEDLHIHPEYTCTEEGIFNDIGLLTLVGRIHYAQSTDIVQFGVHTMKHGVKLLVAGWGSIKPVYDKNDIKLSQTLKILEVKVISNILCQSSYKQRIRRTQICAVSPNYRENICKGDGGSPLIDLGKIIGVASTAYCGIPEYPAIYTRVREFVPFIQGILRSTKKARFNC